MSLPIWTLPVPRCARKLRIHSPMVAVILAVCVLGAAGTNRSQSVTSDDALMVKRGVEEFMQTVSHSVTQEGPLAWLKYFEESPTFFMAVNGQMAFPDGASAQEGTRKFAQTIRRLELAWGDVRVDPLTNHLAVVAASWHETQVDNTGHSVNETGYFTGLAEYRDGRWQFRNAHWSAPVSPP
jgi:hypothetical protein